MLGPLLTWAGIVGALGYLPLTEDEPSLQRSLLKAIPLAFFTLAALAIGGGPFLVAGLFLSLLGDVALSRRGQAAFLYGLGAFALAHLLYIFHFLSLSQASIGEAFVVNAPLSVCLVAYAILSELWLVPYAGALKWPVRIYVVLIMFMGLAALTLPLGIAFLGAAFFIASDTLLAFQMFRMSDENPLIGRLGWSVWISYVAGQAMILSA